MYKKIIGYLGFILLLSSFAFAENLDLVYNNTDGTANNWECVAGFGVTDDGDQIKLEWTDKDKNCYWYWNNSFIPKDDTVYKITYTLNQTGNIITLMAGIESGIFSPSTRADATNKLRYWNSTNSKDITNVIFANRLYNYTWYFNTTLIGSVCNFNLTVYDVTADSSILTFNDYIPCYTVDIFSFKQRAFNFQSQKDGDTYTTYLDDIYIHELLPPIADSSTIDILFSNETDIMGYKSTFGEGEDFITWINWTNDADNSALSENNGTCNITVFEGIVEQKSLFDNFTICDIGCDFDTYNETFTFADDNTTGNVMTDSIRGSVCHEDNPDTSDISVIVSCGLKNITINQSADIIPLCSEGFGDFIVETDICVNSLQVNISAQPLKNVPFNKRRRVIDLEIDREFFEDVNTFPTEIRFNNTYNIWELYSHEHEYYTHGNKTIRGVCTHLTNNLYDNSVNETMTIVNVPPLVFNPILQTDLGLTILTDNTLIEFAFGLANLTIPIIDDDLDTINISIYNVSTVIFSANNGSFSLNMTDLFLDFEFNNPITINITANDTTGDTTTLNIANLTTTDTQAPTCTGIENVTIVRGQPYNFNITCLDEYLWSFDVTCNNTFNSSFDTIANTYFNFINQTTILNDTFCNYSISDGHTDKLDKLLKADIIKKDTKTNTLTFDGINLTTKEKIKDITYTFLYDRVSFCFETDIKENTLTFNIPENCKVAPNSKYKGHIVCKKNGVWSYAVDLDGEFPVNFLPNQIEVDVSKAKSNKHCFKSIVELNTLNVDQLITARNPFTLFENRVNQEFESIPQAMTWMFLYFIWLFFLMATFLVRGDTNRTVQLFSIFQCFIGISVGLGFMAFSWVIGLGTVLVATAVFVGKSLYSK